MLGPVGSFSYLASRKLGSRFRKKFAASFSQIFKSVRAGSYGFVPVRNSSIGEIAEVKKMLDIRKFEIIKRVRFPIRHAIVAKRKIKLGEIRKIYCSKIIAAQCRKFLRSRLKNARIMAQKVSSTSLYKKIAHEGDFFAATIGPAQCAKMYKLTVLARGVQDDPRNCTTFVLFRRRK